MVTVYAVASAKGGVGKTTTTAALATVLSESGADVVAVDADIGMANLAGVLGMEVGETTVHDVLAGRADPFDAIHDGPAGLRVVPGDTDLDAYAEADPSGIRDVIRAFDDVDYVLVDAGAGLSHDSSLPLVLADETLLVSTPERGALGDTEKTRQLTERLGGSVAGAAITRVDPAEPETALTDELLDAEVLGRIPEDESVAAAERATEPLVTFAPTAPAATAYRELARALTGEPVPGPDAAESPSEDGSGRATAPVAGAKTAGSNGSVEDDTTDEGGDELEDDMIGDNDGDGTDDDILVADAGSVGIGDAGDEEEILVADETPVADSDESEDGEFDDGAGDDDPSVEPEVTESSADAETDDAETDDAETDDAETDDAETDDAEADDAETDDAETDDAETDDAEADDIETDDAEADDATDSDDTDEVASLVDEAEPAVEESESDDVDDELAGSVPFRDDDSDTDGNVVADEGVDATGENEADEDGTDADTKADESRGFFNRLFGR